MTPGLPFLLQWERLYGAQCSVSQLLRGDSERGSGPRHTRRSWLHGHFRSSHAIGHSGLSQCHQPLGDKLLCLHRRPEAGLSVNRHGARLKPHTAAGQGAPRSTREHTAARQKVPIAPLRTPLSVLASSGEQGDRGLTPNCNTQQTSVCSLS